MKAARPNPPAGLGAAGKRAWRAAHAALAEDVRFTAAELERLRLIAGQTDFVDELERSGETKGLTAARTALARLWNELPLTVDAGEELGAPIVNRRAQRAAQARWRARQEVAKQRKALGA